MGTALEVQAPLKPQPTGSPRHSGRPLADRTGKATAGVALGHPGGDAKAIGNGALGSSLRRESGAAPHTHPTCVPPAPRPLRSVSDSLSAGRDEPVFGTSPSPPHLSYACEAALGGWGPVREWGKGTNAAHTGLAPEQPSAGGRLPLLAPEWAGGLSSPPRTLAIPSSPEPRWAR